MPLEFRKEIRISKRTSWVCVYEGVCVSTALGTTINRVRAFIKTELLRSSAVHSCSEHIRSGSISNSPCCCSNNNNNNQLYRSKNYKNDSDNQLNFSNNNNNQLNPNDNNNNNNDQLFPNNNNNIRLYPNNNNNSTSQPTVYVQLPHHCLSAATIAYCAKQPSQLLIDNSWQFTSRKFSSSFA